MVKGKKRDDVQGGNNRGDTGCSLATIMEGDCGEKEKAGKKRVFKKVTRRLWSKKKRENHKGEKV